MTKTQFKAMTPQQQADFILSETGQKPYPRVGMLAYTNFFILYSQLTPCSVITCGFTSDAETFAKMLKRAKMRPMYKAFRELMRARAN